MLSILYYLVTGDIFEGPRRSSNSILELYHRMLMIDSRIVDFLSVLTEPSSGFLDYYNPYSFWFSIWSLSYRLTDSMLMEKAWLLWLIFAYILELNSKRWSEWRWPLRQWCSHLLGLRHVHSMNLQSFPLFININLPINFVIFINQ